MTSPLPSAGETQQPRSSYWSLLTGRISSAKDAVYDYTVSKPARFVQTTYNAAYLGTANRIASVTTAISDQTAQLIHWVGNAGNTVASTIQTGASFFKESGSYLLDSGSSLAANASTTLTQTPVVLGGNNFNPLLPTAPNTKETLAKIKGLSINILDESEKNGVRRDLIDDRLPVEPKVALPVSSAHTLPPPSAPASQTVSSPETRDPSPSLLRPPVSEVPIPSASLKEDEIPHKVPVATGPRVLSDPADIKKKTDGELDKFCKKLSDFSTVSYIITTICGIKEPDNTSLFQLVAAASEKKADGTYPSLWALINEKYELTLLQKIRAGLFYFWFYKITALIPNTVDTYLKCFVNAARTQLTDKNSLENSDKQIQRVVDNANGFLKSYNAATNDFISDAIPPVSSLTEYRTNRIAMHYGGSIWEDARYPGPSFEQALEEAAQRRPSSSKERPSKAMLVTPYMNRSQEILCKQFSRAIVDTYSPHVEFFKNWKHHSVGKVFTPLFNAIEGILNKYLRYVMKTQILPTAFLQAIAGGTDATSKHNLPFSNALTRFIADQINKLEATLAQSPPSPNPSFVPPPPIEHLEHVVTELFTTLEESSLGTKEQIKKHREDQKTGKSEIDKTIQVEIKKAITEASQSLFHYLAQPANAEATFAQLLETANSAFSDTTPRTDEQYEKSKIDLIKRVEDLKEKARIVFKKMGRQSVEKKVKGTPLAQEIAGSVFEDQKAEAMGAFDQLHHLSEKMVNTLLPPKKINPLLAPREIDLRTEIASFAQIMKTFAEREKGYHGIDSLDPVDQEEIRRILAPLYDQAASAMEKTKKLQEIQKTYSFHSRIVKELLKIESELQSILTQSILTLDPSGKRARLEFSLEMREKIRDSIAEIGSNLPNFPQIQEELSAHLENLRQRFNRFNAEIRLLQGIEKLFPKDGSRGLIKNLLDYRRGEREELPTGFHIKDCLAEIHQILPSYDKEVFSEAEALKALIESSFDKDVFPEAEALKAQIEQTLSHLKSGFKGEWDRLGKLIEQLRSVHEATKGQVGLDFQKSKREFHQTIQRYNHGYTVRKVENQGDMLKTATALSEEIGLMKAEAAQIQKGAQFHLTESKMGAAGALATGLGAGIGGAISAILGTGFLPGASAGSSLVSTGLYRGIERQNLSRVIDKGSTNIAPVATAIAAGAAAPAIQSILSSLSPGLGIAATAATVAAGVGLGNRAGAALLGEAVDSGQAKVSDEVEKWFDHAFNFITGSDREHIFHGAITRLMKTTIDTHSPS